MSSLGGFDSNSKQVAFICYTEEVKKIIKPALLAPPDGALNTPPLPFTIHATLKKYARYPWGTQIIATLLLSFIVLGMWGVTTWITSIVIAGIVIAIVVFLYARRFATLDEEGLTYRDMFGIHHHYHRTAIKRVTIFAHFVQRGFGGDTRVIIESNDGKSFSFFPLFWNSKDLDALISLLYKQGVPIYGYEDPVSRSDLACDLPELLPLNERRPYLLALGVALLVIISVAIIIFLTSSR